MTVGGFPHDGEIRLPFEQQPEALPEQPLILGNQESNGHTSVS